jgi:hypothetical protein
VLNTLNNNVGFSNPFASTQEYNGHYCYEWSWGLASAIESENSGCFNVQVKESLGGSSPYGSTYIHQWVQIEHNGGGGRAYVDDSFGAPDAPEPIFAHPTPPNPYGPEQAAMWKYPHCPHREGKCTPVTAYDGTGNPVPKPKWPAK